MKPTLGFYPHLHKGTERMIELSHHEAEDELQERALNQAAGSYY
jgi:1,4-alpha-glucan branching enzyme